MAHDVGKNDVRLYQGQVNPKDIVLRDLEATAAATGTTIYLRTLDANPKDVVLYNPVEASAAALVSFTINATSANCVFLGSANPATSFAINAVSEDSVFSGSAGSQASFSFSATSEDAVFTGSAGVYSAFSFNAVGEDTVFSGSASSNSEPSYSQEVELNLVDLKPRPKPQHQEISELAEKLEQVEEQKVELETEIRAARKKKNVAKIKTQEYDELKTYIYLLSIELNALTVDLSGLQEQIRAMQAIEDRLAWQQSINEQNMLELDMAFVLAMMAEE